MDALTHRRLEDKRTQQGEVSMNTSNWHTAEASSQHAVGTIIRRAFRVAIGGVRLPILAVLVILEPIVRFVLATVALLGIITAILFESSAAAPTFPFWGMIGFSIGCVLVLALYYALMRLLGHGRE
jgi:ABC-type polysaccharide/polyol phosphate export permease